MTGLNRDLAIIQGALVASAQACRYHGQNWDFLGREFGDPNGPPRCDSCKQPWRIAQALDALDRIARAEVAA